ncbi:MAG: hypothetical protein V3T83_22350, partial [Acidobacteriota bacterium]
DRERAEARRNLAKTLWKFHRNFDEASQLLAEAAQIPADQAKAWIERAEMEIWRPDYGKARNAAQKAIQSAQSSFDKRAATVVLARAAVEEAVEKRLAAQSLDRDWLFQAFQPLSQLVESQPGDLEASELLLRLSILMDRGPEAWAAWRSYYHVTEVDPAPNLVAEPGQRLDSILASWKGAQASRARRASLADALSDSRFHLEAALVALDPQAIERDGLLKNPRVAEIVAYARFCLQIQSLSSEFYRQTSLGKGDKGSYHRQLKEAVAKLWPELDGPRSSAPAYRNTSSFRSAINSELQPRFGGHFNLGNTAGYRSLHFGHQVARDSKTVEQYGHKASVSYTVLDRMVSNGFQSWAWNSTAQTGGWANANSIVAVRSALISDIVNVWNIYDSAEERSIYEEKLKKDSLLDDDRAEKDPAGYLPGLHFRMAFQAVNQIVDELKDQGQTEDRLRIAFINEVKRIGDESMIFAHEGRHAIDKNLDPSMKSAQLEFTAKLSQVAFSSHPRLSVTSILGENSGGRTPHGQANRRFAQGVVEWMKKNRAEIAGFDASRPCLPQFDLLTDEQIRAAARSMDPLARD